MKKISLAIALLSTSVSLQHAHAQLSRAEHTIYVRVETQPQGAIVSTVPANTDEDSVVLGKTPFVIPVGCDWDRSYMRKKWDRLRLTTTGNIATNAYDPDDKTHAITLTFAIEKEGHQRQLVQQVAAVLTYNEKAENWDQIIRAQPERRSLTYTLIPQPDAQANGNAAGAQPTASSNGKAATVILARGENTEPTKSGYLQIDGPAGTPVYVDGLSAGKAPIRVMLSEGQHTVGTIGANGKPLPTKSITIEADKTLVTTLEAPSAK